MTERSTLDINIGFDISSGTKDHKPDVISGEGPCRLVIIVRREGSGVGIRESDHPFDRFGFRELQHRIFVNRDREHPEVVECSEDLITDD